MYLGQGGLGPFLTLRDFGTLPKSRNEATAMGTGGTVGGRSLPIDIRIKEYTSDEEVQRLATILKESGQGALRRELEKLDVGQISPVGRIGTPIAVARSHETENGRIVNIMTARYLSFLELYQSGRSRDYPFGVVSLQLDEEEKGLGNVIVAAKIKFEDDDQIVIESFGHQYVQISNVRKLK